MISFVKLSFISFPFDFVNAFLHYCSPNCLLIVFFCVNRQCVVLHSMLLKLSLIVFLLVLLCVNRQFVVPSNTYPIEFITSPAGEFQFSETVQRITQNIASHQYQYHHSLFKNIFSQTIHKDDNKEGFVLVDNLKRLTPFSPNIQSILTTMTINAQSNSIYVFSQFWTKF